MRTSPIIVFLHKNIKTNMRTNVLPELSGTHSGLSVQFTGHTSAHISTELNIHAIHLCLPFRGLDRKSVCIVFSFTQSKTLTNMPTQSHDRM